MLDTVGSVTANKEGRKRLRTFFVSVFALIMLVCVLGLSLIWEPRVARVMVSSQTKNLDSQVNLLSDALVPFLLQNDFGAIFETLKTTQAQIPTWKVVMLNNMDGGQLYPLSEVETLTGVETVTSDRIISFEGRDLAVLSVGVDISEEIGQIRNQVRELSVLLSMFFLGTLVLLGLFFERWVVRRIAVLASAARQMSLGDYDARLPGGRNDEIGQLTDSFGTMRRTIRHNEAKLIASRDEAERAAEAKSRFLAMMSHEIRTPLNGVIPTAELLLEGKLNADQAMLVGTIQDSGKALKAIIDDILDISKLDEGKFVIRAEQFSLIKMVTAVAGMFQVDAGKKGLRLNLEIAVDCSDEVIGDGDRIRQVLINLVGNALKFTSKGDVTIRVGCDKNGASTLFEVVDSGIGISDEDQAQVFDRFTQVDNRSNREFQGSGLGLSICNLLVDAMGGELKVKSRLGEGSCFFFSVPLEAVAKVKALPSNRDRAERVLTTSAVASAGKSKILVVDDNKTNLKIAGAILASMQHSVVTVESGEEALSRLAEEAFDLILMDVNMPGIDGLETTRRIRQISGASGKTVVLGLSASAFAEDIELCIQSGMNGFVAKPISKKKLEAELEKYLELA